MRNINRFFIYCLFINIFFFVQSAGAQKQCDQLFLDAAALKTQLLPLHVSEKFAKATVAVEQNFAGITYLNPQFFNWKSKHGTYFTQKSKTSVTTVEIKGPQPAKPTPLILIAEELSLVGIPTLSHLTTDISLNLSSTSHQKIRVYIREQNIVYMAEALMTNQPTDFIFKFSKMTQLDQADIVALFDYQLKSVAFELLEPLTETTKNFSLAIKGPIILEKDFSHNPSFYAQKIYETFIKNYKNAVPLHNNPREKIILVLEKTIRSLYSKKLQEESVQSLIHLTEQQIQAEMKYLGFNWVAITGQLTPSDFFFLSEMPMQRPAIPIEKGDFGNEHGVFSHAEQIKAIRMGLTDHEFAIFRDIYKFTFGDNIDGWRFWDTFFDAPGNRSPNGPRFWRDLTIKLKGR